MLQVINVNLEQLLEELITAVIQLIFTALDHLEASKLVFPVVGVGT